MGFEIRISDAQAGNAKRYSHNKTGKDEAEPLCSIYFDGPGTGVSVEYYYSK
jgi:hypothetical protein